MPHIAVLMTKRDVANYPIYSLPAGYQFCGYQPGDEEAWAALQVAVGQMENQATARQIFQEVFLSVAAEEQITKKCLFVKNQADQIVATASLWHGEHFGTSMQRIHYVAVAEQEAGKGIAKAMLTKLLNLYHELGLQQEFLYLTTQTESYVAIQLYLTFGFVPYCGVKPPNFKLAHYQEQTPKAWAMIRAKIESR